MTNKKKSLAIVCAALMISVLAIPCFATGGTSTSTGISSDITSAMTTGFQQISSDALAVLSIIIPIAFSIVGVVWIAKKAIRWFKSMSSPG